MRIFKKVQPLGWLALCSILLISSVIILLFVNHTSFASKQSSNVKGVKPIYTFKNFSSDEKLSKYPGLHLHTSIEGTDTYSMAINYPFTNNNTIDQPITDWIDHQKDEFLKTVEHENSSAQNDFMSHLNIQVGTNIITKNTYNIVLSAYHYIDGANGITYEQSFIIDVDNGEHIGLNDIFIDVHSEAFKEKLQHEINSIIENNNDYKDAIDQNAAQDYIQDVENSMWRLTKNSFTIYFDEYEVKPRASGIVEFKIPINHLKSYITNEWLEKFELAEEIAERKKIEQEAKQQQSSASENEQTNDPNHENGKYIALTFDDGPHPDVTPRILDTLNEYNAKATFFMLGLQAEYYPALAAEVANQGHEIANHTYNHTDITSLDHNQLMNEIVTTNDKIEQATSKKPKLFRPPFGSYNEQVINVAEQNGLSIILWSVDSLDWKNRDLNTIHSTVTANASVGSTVLLHDIHPTTADALPEVLETLSAQGYQFVTVSELLNIQGKSGVGPF